MCDPSLRASLSLQRSLVEQSHEFGVSIFGSDGLVQQTVVRRSMPNGGDGIAVASFETPAAATIENSFVDDSARAGIANFGAFVALSGTHLRCAAIAIAADPYDGMDFELEDRGNNRCGCPNAEDPCAASSVNLMPPSPPSSSD